MVYFLFACHYFDFLSPAAMPPSPAYIAFVSFRPTLPRFQRCPFHADAFRADIVVAAGFDDCRSSSAAEYFASTPLRQQMFSPFRLFISPFSVTPPLRLIMKAFAFGDLSVFFRHYAAAFR